MSDKLDKMNEERKAEPRWDLVNELYEWCDKGVVEIAEKKEMNFIEAARLRDQIKFLKSSDHSLSSSNDLINIKNSLDNIRELI